MLRAETKARARALQLLYAREFLQGQSIAELAERFAAAGVARDHGLAEGECLAEGVVSSVARLDAEIADVAEHWRFERIGIVERNILRLALYELITEAVPPRVAIAEAVRLAWWFAGPKAPAFVNGVLDTLARRAGRL